MTTSTTTILTTTLNSPNPSPNNNHSSGDPDLAFPADPDTLAPVFTDKHEERRHLKHRLALAFRIFGKHGFGEGVAGHITLRDPIDPHTFWVNPFGMDFSLITDDDLILVDSKGKVIDGGRNRLLNYGKNPNCNIPLTVPGVFIKQSKKFVLLDERFSPLTVLVVQAAFAIHSEIHEANPNINCAAHSHSLYGRAFCATGRELQMLSQDACVFYKDHAVYR